MALLRIALHSLELDEKMEIIARLAGMLGRRQDGPARTLLTERRTAPLSQHFSAFADLQRRRYPAEL